MEGAKTRTSSGIRALKFLVCVAATAVFVMGAGEVFLFVFDPQVSYFPRWVFSPEYELMLPANTTIIHKRPRHWEFKYTTNEHRGRGAAVPISNSYDKANVIVLGDSYGMGTSVNDGEDFAAVIDRELEGRADVINTAVGGWGLTQQIRRFYEFGRLYDPSVVILQYCSNDPDNNLSMRVTTVDNGRFVFHNSTRSKGFITRLVSRSYIVQHSQLYSLFRSVYETRRAMAKRQEESHAPAEASPSSRPVSPAEVFYNELLEAFAKDLSSRGIHFLMISERSWFDMSPAIDAKVKELSALGLVEYFAIDEWLGDPEEYVSPEGHWNSDAHRIIGEHLARRIEESCLN